MRKLALVVIAGSLLAAVLVAEAAARLLFPHWAPRTGRVTAFWQPDARYGWAHVPGAAGVFESYGIGAPVAINAKGFRGPAVPYARTPGKARVVFLGDSYVWGFGVPDEDVFTTRLARRFPDMEIVNLGVSGYGTDQELLLYREEARRYAADRVVVVVAVNDLASILERTESVIYGKPVFVLDERGALRLENFPVRPTPWLKRAIVRTAWHSYVLTQAHRWYADRRAAALEGLQAAPEAPFPRSQSERLLVRLLEEFDRAVTADRSRLLVVLVDGFGWQADAIAQYLDHLGIDTVTLDRYVTADDPTLHLPDGFHWNAAGHAIVADALAGRLAARLAAREGA